MPRSSDVRDRILDAAEGLVLEQGFAATTVDAILDAATASKGAFFHHFPSKAQLGEALVARYADADRAIADALMADAEARSDEPGAQLLAFLDGFQREAEKMASERPGCLFVSFIYESGLVSPGIDATVMETVRYWRDRIVDKLEQVARNRPHLEGLDLDSLADQVFTTFEGGFLLARALGDPSVLPRQLGHVRRYFELLLAEPARRGTSRSRGTATHRAGGRR